ncbi:ABC transporter permease [Spiroplasma endosymbiont of Crioceris asparagi]|uniref:ABC transporter permease n=1 Tax=Spiroplasma endosymbiont of Crioceris asparagi TaxID=3066286 RepID=UPI0030CADDEA
MNMLLSSNLSGFSDYGFSLASVLIIASLAGLMCEKAGVVNIAIEGMMTIGALVTAILGKVINTDTTNVNLYNQLYVVLIAGVVTIFIALIHGYISITLKSNQIISGTAINLLALGIAAFIVSSGYFGLNGNVNAIDAGYRKPIEICGIQWWFIIAIVICAICAIFLIYTKYGKRYISVGENPNAVDAAGISVNKYRYIAVCVSGFLSGIAGGVLVVSKLNSGEFTGTTNGYGYLAMAILIFGQWKIHYVSIGALMFAFLFSFALYGNNLIQDSDFIRKNQNLLKTIPFIITIAVMVLFSKKSQAPAANGVPFDKSKR